MATCKACGNPIGVDEGENRIGERDLVYHVSCAPDDLLRDAVTEWNAIVARGIRYYVERYLPGEIAPAAVKTTKKDLTDEELADYQGMFTSMGMSYRTESLRRKKNQR